MNWAFYSINKKRLKNHPLDLPTNQEVFRRADKSTEIVMMVKFRKLEYLRDVIRKQKRVRLLQEVLP